MSEWDFLWGLEGQELLDTMSSGGTKEDWDYIEEQERRLSVRKKWEELKRLRDNREISIQEFKKRKQDIFK